MGPTSGIKVGCSIDTARADGENQLHAGFHQGRSGLATLPMRIDELVIANRVLDAKMLVRLAAAETFEIYNAAFLKPDEP